MKSLLYLVLTILSLTPFAVAQQPELPCDKLAFQVLCNPSLKLTERCYDCHNLKNDKLKCVPAFKNLDITEFMSSKKWECTEHEWKNPFSKDSEEEAVM